MGMKLESSLCLGLFTYSNMRVPGVKTIIDSCASSDKVVSSMDITIPKCNQIVFDRVVVIHGYLKAVCKSCNKY